MAHYFITSSGTGIGKTLVTSALIHALRQRNVACAAIKPVISGVDLTDAESVAASDSAHLLRAQGLPATPEQVTAISPWRYKAPLSPHMAAAREGAEIALPELVRFCQSATEQQEHTLIEGVGGLMVPLNRRETVLDWAKALNLPLIMVVGSYLGSLSHSLTALAVAKQAGLKVAAVVVSDSGDGAVPLAETTESLQQFAQVACPFVSLPRQNIDTPTANAQNRWEKAAEALPDSLLATLF